MIFFSKACLFQNLALQFISLPLSIYMARKFPSILYIFHCKTVAFSNMTLFIMLFTVLFLLVCFVFFSEVEIKKKSSVGNYFMDRDLSQIFLS